MTSICGNEDEELAVHVEPPSEFSFFLGTTPMTMIANFISYKQHMMIIITDMHTFIMFKNYVDLYGFLCPFKVELNY